MTHRFPIPSDAEIESLIVQALESLPNAEQSRLSLIESKLLQKAKKDKSQNNLNKIPWWIVLLLAGGFATAAWWVGETMREDLDIKNVDKHTTESKNPELNNEQIRQENEEQHAPYNIEQNKRSSVIYQRENL